MAYVGLDGGMDRGCPDGAHERHMRGGEDGLLINGRTGGRRAGSWDRSKADGIRAKKNPEG